eukprot:2002672-Prorocentrum_lima.AAC.1
MEKEGMLISCVHLKYSGPMGWRHAFPGGNVLRLVGGSIKPEVAWTVAPTIARLSELAMTTRD